MFTRVLSTRVLAALTAVPLVIAGCSSTASQSASAPATQSNAVESASVTPLAGPAPMPAAPAPPACGAGSALLASMSTRDKLAQLLMVGVRNAADARAVVNTYHVGGIMIGSWTDLSMLTDGSLGEMADLGPLPLAVSVDEEGGRVSRLSTLIGPAPSARTLAQTQTPEQVYQLAFSRGQQMRGLGITIDFAPVVDVSDQADDTVIGDRSFSDDPATVTTYAGAFARGLRAAGVLPVLKHFPGHGQGSGDSHTAGVVSTPPLSDLMNRDLVPYVTLTTEAPVAVMIGHLEVPGLTGNTPASLSPAAINLLRSGGYGGPGFNGPVFSDDLSSMAAISSRYGVAEAVLRALQAGTDVALWVTTAEVPVVLDRLEKAVAAGELAMPAVEGSVLRMAGIKGPSGRCGG
jgi:beta-N-acetylhexosaminidase